MKLSTAGFVIASVLLSPQESTANLGQAVVTQTRRLLNFGSLFGNPRECAATPYDRIMGHPVFQVTTSWGSAYMTMERLMEFEDSDKGESSIFTKGSSKLKSIKDDHNRYRTISLYFMDPEDALATHAELMQMQQMKKSDIRITSVSLGKALRSAANLGGGLVTGFPVEPLTGKLKSLEEGGSLRHKIMPPKRQLYYAAHCIGKERVGFFGDNAAEDASLAILGNSALESKNLIRRRNKADRKTIHTRAKTAMQAKNAHMEGYTGIPVFWAQGMHRQPPLLKQLISGNRQETPMFFNYEDLMDAWNKMKQSAPQASKLPDQPTVEVFNLWDVLTSMDKEQWKQTKAQKYDWARPLRQRFGKNETPDLDSITFVPSSRAIDYKQSITARGNGKARLRPMR